MKWHQSSDFPSNRFTVEVSKIRKTNHTMVTILTKIEKIGVRAFAHTVSVPRRPRASPAAFNSIVTYLFARVVLRNKRPTTIEVYRP